MKKENIIIDIDDEIAKKVSDVTKDKELNLVEKINDILYYALLEEGISVDEVLLTISIASKEEIRKINNEYRKVDRATDVLSFPIFDKLELENIAKQKDENKKVKELQLGDIILCLDVIEEQSVEYQTGMLRETLYMITHGICHLLGYDHIEENDKIKMRALEEKILEKVGVPRREE